MVPETSGIIQRMTPIEESDAPLDSVCQRCERMVEAHELEECPVCKRKYCTFCVYRVGSRNYCSRPCGDSYFFGGELDGDSDGDEEE